uniref:Uncharacterized protein n=1 Tax=Brugia malayi TaxID=6279 RepID=A0A912H0P4_BRUMA
MLRSHNTGDVKKDKKTNKLLSVPITIWIYVILVLFLVSTMVICIRGLIDYGFTLDSVPNFLLIIILLIVSIVNVFAITTERKLFILLLIWMIITLVILTVVVFLYRVYVFRRDSGTASELFWSAITYIAILTLFGIAFYVVNCWKRIVKKKH